MSLIDSFITTKLKQDAILFKGMSCDFSPSYNKASWFSFDINDAKAYHERVHAFKTKRELKLINVQSLFFQMDFSDKINKKYGGKTQEGLLALATVGLPSLKAQKAVLTHQPGECDNPESITHVQSEYYNGKHRYSFFIDDENTDMHLVNHLIEFYPNFDGYIVPNEWPSCFHSGNFHKEICIFKPKNIVVYLNDQRIPGGDQIKQKKTKHKKQSAGTSCGDPRDDITIDDYNRISKRSMRAIGWTGPELYDEDGYLRMPSLDEIDRFRQLSIQPNVPQYVIDNVLEARRARGELTPGYDDGYWDTVEYVN